MNILKERTGTAMTIHGEAIMLSRYGEIYNVIDNLMHPNPGTEEDEYSEIERPVDWLLSNHLFIEGCKAFIKYRVYDWLSEEPNSDLERTLQFTMYTDLYNPSSETVKAVEDAMNSFNNDSEENIDKVLNQDEVDLSRKIANFINEKFCRVRAGGKLNPEGANEIYFRISSHGYDWHRTIVDFLWDVFGSPKEMPAKIWIGHDAETNPPETVLFYGTPQELLEKEDGKIFESFIDENVQKDQEAYKLNKKYMESISKLKNYIPYK